MSRIKSFWQQRSLKFWLASGLVMTIAPVCLLAVLGYLRFHSEIVQPLVAVTEEQSQVLQPLNQIEINLWDVSRAVVDYAATGQRGYADSYVEHRDLIDQAFVRLEQAVARQPLLEQDVRQALADWRAVTEDAEQVLGLPPRMMDTSRRQPVLAFEDDIDRLGHDLGKLFEDVRLANEASHRRALAAITQFDQLALAALLLSVVFGVLGLWIINRSLIDSMNRLSDGAMKFADGDPDHRIEVRIPYELAGVADTFNTMRSKILLQQRELETAAITDSLTGLHNRRHFDRMLAQECLRAERFGQPLALVLCDIDHFKKFNDTYGHQNGDRVLKAVSEALHDAIRQVDVVCRYGGEEFVVILPNCDREQAGEAAERLRQTMAALSVQLADGQTVAISGSFGVAIQSDQDSDPETLIRRADDALYDSKRHGRDRVTLAAATEVT
ncbi:sensor domain-containing diguanylate cyclase [Marinobacter xestospongiae]|uniref:diguanylate cyclase n=1 Tax=Marinobacter xestospongiae TaxID=994319 RepID=A0ABU3VZ32_9GAMM|nr:diguanylate cyclase [Marinobacter xestospongiae]MDV2079544.1 diguanylate cyclase [Marinobacter xestospongiae]